MSEIASWYYVGSLGQLGPLTLEQLDELVEGGVIELTTYVWKPGMTDWITASLVPDLQATFNRVSIYQSPPPTPAHYPPQFSGPVNPQSQSQFHSPTAPPVAPTTYQNLGPVQGQSYTPAPYQNSFATYPYGQNAPRSDRSRTAAGVLQLIIPGAGRIYLGYTALGVIQLFFSFATCFLLHLWSIIDGIFILSGKVNLDGYGRVLPD